MTILEDKKGQNIPSSKFVKAIMTRENQDEWNVTEDDGTGGHAFCYDILCSRYVDIQADGRDCIESGKHIVAGSCLDGYLNKNIEFEQWALHKDGISNAFPLQLIM